MINFKQSRTRQNKKEKKIGPEARRKQTIMILLLALSFSLCFFIQVPLASLKLPVAISGEGGRFKLLVDSKQFVIKAVCYSPIPIGKNHAHDFWQQDLGVFQADAELMKEMGVNAIRIYGPGRDINRTKEIIRLFYNKYGIRTIMGNWLGFWEGAYPDYANEDFRQRIKRECLDMVREFKDEPAVLIWILGNENNFSFGRQKLRAWTSPELEEIKDPLQKREAQAKIYYKFVEEIAREVKKIDKIHLVALGNGGTDSLDVAKKFCFNVDLLACSIYNGKSFSSVFRQVRQLWQKPFFFSEFGSDSYDAYLKKPDEDMQAEFIVSQWKEIEKNSATGNAEGNCLGGAIFEWTDEWWKVDEYDISGAFIHDEKATWSNGAYYFDIAAERNLNMNEEWWGIVKLIEKDSASLRVPKKAFFALKELWQEPAPFCPNP